MELSVSIDEQFVELVNSKSWIDNRNENSNFGDDLPIGFKSKDEISISHAICDIIKSSAPSIFAMLSRRTMDTLNYSFIGRLDNSDYIAGAGLAIISANMWWYSMALGIAGGLDTLSSQAFGSKNNYLAGCYYKRAQVIQTFMFIVQAIILWNIEGLMIAAGQSAAPAKHAASFIKVYLPGIYFACQTELLRKFLSVQGEFYLLLKIQLAAIFSHLLCLLFFVYYLEMAINGVALSNSITFILIFIAANFYITVKKDVVKENWWHSINKDSFKGIIEYLRYGIPSMIMMCLEFYWFESLMLMAGILGTDSQGAWIITLNIAATLFMIPLGISFSVTNLVGNSLGANKPKIAKLYAIVSNVFVFLLSLIFVILLYIFRFQVARVYTNHEKILNLIMETLPLMIAFLVVDYVQCVAGGVIRAMGFQKIGCYVCLINYWFIAIPLTALFTFHYHYGVRGIWVGMPISLFLISACFLAIIYYVDWDKLSATIKLRIEKEKQGLISHKKGS